MWILPIHVHERVSATSSVVLILGNSTSNHVLAHATFHKLCSSAEPYPCCHTQHLRSLRSQKTMSGRPTQFASKTGVGTTGLFLCSDALYGLDVPLICGDKVPYCTTCATLLLSASRKSGTTGTVRDFAA